MTKAFTDEEKALYKDDHLMSSRGKAFAKENRLARIDYAKSNPKGQRVWKTGSKSAELSDKFWDAQDREVRKAENGKGSMDRASRLRDASDYLRERADRSTSSMSRAKEHLDKETERGQHHPYARKDNTPAGKAAQAVKDHISKGLPD